jgi:hypothetical protein
MKKVLFIIAMIALVSANAFSQIEKPVKWSFAVKKRR